MLKRDPLTMSLSSVSAIGNALRFKRSKLAGIESPHSRARIAVRTPLII